MAKDEHGIVSKEKIRAQYDGSVWVSKEAALKGHCTHHSLIAKNSNLCGCQNRLVTVSLGTGLWPCCPSVPLSWAAYCHAFL